ncbi:unnamed protein product [Brachionus calyciflorus]|uniref:Enkurin domain-containing protein n=1 Tax=Brachionus calyciflorus TaxID=104777 RepID=A0A813Q8N1_9BILA|nr:unnamed protein product [Brachionus calyciflorus]
MCEGISTINGPIPPHPMFLKENSFSSISARSTTNSLCEGPSKLTGPIVSHFSNESGSVDYSKNPRVRDSGKANFLANKNGNGVALLIELQGRSIVPQTFKIREKPKNYIASNTHKIKEIMRKTKEREAQKEHALSEKNAPIKAVDKFNNVQSKVKEMLQKEPQAPRETKEFLRAHSKTGQISRPQSARPSTANSVKSNKSTGSKDDIDFIRQNQLLAKESRIRRAPSVEVLKSAQEKLEKDLENYNKKIKGKVPQYLENRKEYQKKAHEEFIKSLPDPEQPPGHRKLSDEERINTLNLLQETHKKLLAELNSLPIRNDTFRLQSTKSEMEKRLVELDEAIKIFSKSKVFVKIES